MSSRLLTVGVAAANLCAALPVHGVGRGPGAGDEPL